MSNAPMGIPTGIPMGIPMMRESPHSDLEKSRGSDNSDNGLRK